MICKYFLTYSRFNNLLFKCVSFDGSPFAGIAKYNLLVLETTRKGPELGNALYSKSPIMLMFHTK